MSLLVAVLALAAAPHVAAAQQIPGLPPGVTPDQALQMLEQNPELGPLLRERIRQSGLSAEQVRTMLRGAGYPSNLLDAYLNGDGEATPPDPSQETLSVVSSLGLAQFSTRDSLLFTGDTLGLRMARDSLRADSIARADSLGRLRRGLQLFGLETFNRPTTQFQPVITGPVSESYILGPGDELVLILTGEVEIARQLPVARGGFIVIPDVGQIPVNGLSLGQLREVLYDRLGRVYSGVSRRADPRTQFDITVSSVRLHSLRVGGEVNVPGTYQIAATGSVLAAIYEAGGLTERANFRGVQVRRGAELVATLDLYDYLLRGIVPSDVPLASGDVIFVPVRGPRVAIGGEVTRPAIYELRPGETLRDLVQIAGGLTPRAATANVTIDRLLPPEQRTGPEFGRTVVTVDLGAVLAGGPGVPLFAGDSVTIFPIRSGRRNAVRIDGEGVWQPGTYQLEPGMRLSDLIRMAGGLRPDVYQGRVQVLRTYADSTQRFLGAHLAEASAPVPQPDLELHELDRVTVYARTEFRPERRVGVYGAVQKAGQVAYADSMTLRDAVLLAGGIAEDASLIEAEISRFQGPGSDSLAVVLRVPLDSSFVVDETVFYSREVGTPTAPEVVLHPYDNVLIHRVPGFELPRTVTLTGEVRYPGTYTLVNRNERLASVIRRAGGLTEQAYANGIRFFRRDGPPAAETQRIERDTTRPRAEGQDSLLGPDFGVPGQARPMMTRVGVDLERVLRDASHSHNLVLERGDSIHVPRFVSVVRVEGSVHSPGTVPFRPGAGVGHYIDGAGGAKRDADKGRTYVQQPNGLIQKGGNPESGAVVVVPEKVRAETGISFVQIMAALSPLISAATTIVVVLAR